MEVTAAASAASNKMALCQQAPRNDEVAAGARCTCDPRARPQHCLPV